MSREGYEGWDSPARSREGASSPRSHRRRGSGRGDDGWQAEGGDHAAAEYGQEGYADQGNYQDGYGQGQYADQGYVGQEQGGSGYSNGYGGYADEAYGSGYGGDGYAARDPYASGDPYATGDYGPADPYAGPDPRASGPHSDPYGRDPYDTGGGYGAAAGYQGQDGYGGQDSYGTQASYGGGGFDAQDDDLYRSRYPQAASDDPGLMRRRRASRESEFDADSPRHDGFFRGFGGGDDDLGGRGRSRSQPRGRPPKQKKSHAGLIALAVVVIVFAGIAGVGYKYYHEYKVRHASYTGSGYGSTLILVQPGDTLDGISAQLLNKHVIAAIDPWASYVANKSGLHPGKYRIHIHMSPAAAYAALTNVKNLVNSKVTIPDGMRLADILPLMAKESGLPLSQFQAAIKNTAALGLPAYAHGHLEGYLYPDTYSIAPGESALTILQTAVKQFNTEAAKIHLVAAANAVQFTPAQVITGASLLEAEVSSKYFPDVARVIDNRLNQGMPLGLDATVAYALGVHTDKLTTSQLNVANPYNTRVNKGLPPGPIDSPDVQAIEAFLHPAAHSAITDAWLYFVTVDKSGTTNFTGSYNQFLTWQALAKRNGVT